MSFFPLPTADEVLDAAGLRVAQINPLYSSGDALSDIAQKIDEVAGVVEQRLLDAAKPGIWPFLDALLKLAYPSYGDDARALITPRQQGIATLATKKLTIASVYMRAGQLNAAYTAKGEQYQAEGEALLEGLEKSIAWIAAQTGTSAENARAVLTSVPVAKGGSCMDEWSGYDWGGRYC